MPRQQELGREIARKLVENTASLKAAWEASSPVKHFYIDQLLDRELVKKLGTAFPDPSTLMLRDSIRERKRVGIELGKYDPIVSDILLAFQEQPVIDAVTSITGMQQLRPDPTFYASGISVMAEGDFLNPHLDNSHDGDLKTYRVLNLLFYCSPDWALENGGNLELWEKGIANGSTVVSQFNRLVVMATDRQSWHSVSPIAASGVVRRCVSNYYFSPVCPEEQPYFHVTTFSGRPDERIKGLILSVDGVLRNTIRRVFPRGIARSKHRLERNP